MKRKVKHYLQWMAKRSVIFVTGLLFAFAVIFIYLLVTGFSKSAQIVTIGIAALSAFFAAVSSIASLLQAVEAQRQRENQERPYVIAYFDGSNRGAMYFVIENKGNSPAVEVSFEFEPVPVDFANRELNEVSIFRKPISFLPPGKVYRQVIDASHKFLADDRPLQYEVDICYSSVSGHNIYDESMEYDLSYLKQATLPNKTVEENLEDISKQLQEINNKFKSVCGSNSILAESPEQYRARVQEGLKSKDQSIPRWKQFLRNIVELDLSWFQ